MRTYVVGIGIGKKSKKTKIDLVEGVHYKVKQKNESDIIEIAFDDLPVGVMTVQIINSY